MTRKRALLTGQVDAERRLEGFSAIIARSGRLRCSDGLIILAINGSDGFCGKLRAGAYPRRTREAAPDDRVPFVAMTLALVIVAEVKDARGLSAPAEPVRSADVGKARRQIACAGARMQEVGQRIVGLPPIGVTMSSVSVMDPSGRLNPAFRCR